MAKAALSFPHLGIILESPSASERILGLVDAYLSHDQQDACLRIERAEGTDYLLLHRGLPFLAARHDGEQFAPLTLPAFFEAVKTEPALHMQLSRTDTGLLLLLSIFLQHRPALRSPCKLTDPQRVLDDVAAQGEDAALVIIDGAQCHLAFCRLGKPVAAYFSREHPGDSADGLAEKILLACYGDGGDNQAELLIFHSLKVRKDDHAGHRFSDYVRGRLGPPPFMLHVRHGTQKISSRLFVEGKATVGRAPANDIVLDHLSVSRKHCAVTWDSTGTDGAFRVADFGGANRTKLNGKEIDRAHICFGDTLGVGEFELHFAAPQEENDPRSDLRTLFVENDGPPSGARLVFGGRSVAIDGPVFTIGKSPKANLRISGMLIRPIQATIVREETGEHRVLPVEGGRSVKLDGNKLPEAGGLLKMGSTIAIGSHQFVFLRDS